MWGLHGSPYCFWHWSDTWGYFLCSFKDVLQLTSESQAPYNEQIFKCEMYDFQVRMRDSQPAHRRKDGRDDAVTGMEEDSVGQQRSKPENPSLFSHGYGISDEDWRRLHISQLHYWKWLIYSEERERQVGRQMNEMWNPVETDTQSFWIVIQ